MSTKLDADDMTAEQVAAYLRANHDFFQEHEELLDGLFIPHRHTGEAVSLLEHLVQRQRDRQAQLSRQMEDMLRAARESERVVVSLHHLALELMTCDSLDDVVATCRDLMCSEFDADSVVLRLIGRGQSGDSSLHFIDPEDRALKQMAGLFQKRQPVCGRLRPKQQIFLFGEENTTIKSAVLIPLFEARKIGVLALGSEHEDRFHPAMGTLFISQLGDLVSRALSLHLEAWVDPSLESSHS
ncbi:DUF484 family protein [Thiothrix eikelboomii]|uniref:GAF domain-containing protein n=1 Tax=Thiothrix eikelboomii TaxID=92487 RepID=A0A1T4VV05_9GAMM|nr:DUF484 family protein [Thiothrix eikelboomii]SKA68803.1 hypothetical protein SAMN02745130_00370 [Thiothrix eikelboomii]